MHCLPQYTPVPSFGFYSIQHTGDKYFKNLFETHLTYTTYFTDMKNNTLPFAHSNLAKHKKCIRKGIFI